VNDIFCHLKVHVDKIVKLLKTKVSILEKFLDTAFRWPIRFRQKVLMVFFELRWNYSPLKEKAVLLPDGLFICFCRYASAALHTATHFRLCQGISALVAGRSAATGPRDLDVVDKNCRYVTNR
jgi:hypothetical protein